MKKLYIYHGYFRTATHLWNNYKHHPSVKYSAFKARLELGWYVKKALREPIKSKE